MYSDEYVPPILTVDNVVFQIIDGELNVLLIERAQEPFKGAYALPGGYNASGETTIEAAARVLKDKTGLTKQQLAYMEQLYTFDTVARDPRGHAVSVTYMGVGKDLKIATSKTTQSPGFFPLSSLPNLAYDHSDIITYALERLRAKLTYTNAVFAVLNEKFTLSQLQAAYEAILSHKLDKRNFRKKFLSLDLIQKTNETFREGAHRPAVLYKFNISGLESLSRSFD